MPSRYAGTEDERRVLNAYIALMRCTESLVQRLAPSLRRYSLTPTQFGVLEALYHLGSLCAGELATKTLRSSGNITLVLDQLERRRLVRRERSTEDRRKVIVHLTPQGQALVEEVLPRHVAEIVREFSVLSAQEQETLRRLCRILGTQRREDPPEDECSAIQKEEEEDS